jgi:hypothetical protein
VDRADALLVQLAAAEAARPDGIAFLFTKTFGGETVSHPGLPDAEIPCHEADLLELEAAGYLRRRPEAGDFVFDVTSEGRRRARQLDHASRASAGGLVGEDPLDWTVRVLPTLEAVGRAYSRAPSPMGVRTEDVVAELGDDADAYATALVVPGDPPRPRRARPTRTPRTAPPRRT